MQSRVRRSKAAPNRYSSGWRGPCSFTCRAIDAIYFRGLGSGIKDSEDGGFRGLERCIS